jgi:hypothetical protein
MRPRPSTIPTATRTTTSPRASLPRRDRVAASRPAAASRGLSQPQPTSASTVARR